MRSFDDLLGIATLATLAWMGGLVVAPLLAPTDASVEVQAGSAPATGCITGRIGHSASATQPLQG